MYRQLYTFGIKCYGTGIRAAAAFNEKAKEWSRGRKSIFKRIEREVSPKGETLWFHAASLGEAEQAVPVMQAMRKKYPQQKILLTFFSPSGMKHFKNNGLADHLFYLPLDTPRNARRFIDLVRPKLAFFIKYEIWPNYFLELQRRNIPHVIAPAVFRPDHFYFKQPHKQFFLPILRKVSSIMVQDERSLKILEEHQVKNVKPVGDTRFDRVLQNARTDFADSTLERFAQQQVVLVGGSTWQPGEEILKKTLDHNPELKMIIAPHDIKKENIERVRRLFGSKNSFRYSEKPADPTRFRVCIIDNIGMLSRLYRYGQMAYIGGAFGKGIHNSLEAAAYGLPLFFGPKHKNFIEPSEMIAQGFAFEIKHSGEMQKPLRRLIDDQEYLKQKSEGALAYVKSKAGVVQKIMTEIEALLGSRLK